MLKLTKIRNIYTIDKQILKTLIYSHLKPIFVANFAVIQFYTND